MEKEFNEELEEAVGRSAQELFDQNPFTKVEIVAPGEDGFKYQAIVSIDTKLRIKHDATP